MNTRKSKPKPKHDDPKQSKRFIAAAREAKADETEEGAQRAFKNIISRLKPKPRDGS